jgi:2-polyprenyl-3-methyl-5-hydroxy-6-metoxy-1,4-benzoquinol methylase
MIEDYTTDDRFDTVILMEVLEHVLNPVFVLGKAASLLAPQGRVLVSVPLRGGPWDHTDNHMRQYIAENLMLDARDAGFSLASTVWEEGQYVYGVLVQ